jgi:hypothetical protein
MPTRRRQPSAADGLLVGGPLAPWLCGESSGLAESAYQPRRRKRVPVGGRAALQQERSV